MNADDLEFDAASGLWRDPVSGQYFRKDPPIVAETQVIPPQVSPQTPPASASTQNTQSETSSNASTGFTIPPQFTGVVGSLKNFGTKTDATTFGQQLAIPKVLPIVFIILGALLLSLPITTKTSDDKVTQEAIENVAKLGNALNLYDEWIGQEGTAVHKLNQTNNRLVTLSSEWQEAFDETAKALNNTDALTDQAEVDRLNALKDKANATQQELKEYLNSEGDPDENLKWTSDNDSRIQEARKTQQEVSDWYNNPETFSGYSGYNTSTWQLWALTVLGIALLALGVLMLLSPAQFRTWMLIVIIVGAILIAAVNAAGLEWEKIKATDPYMIMDYVAIILGLFTFFYMGKQGKRNEQQ